MAKQKPNVASSTKPKYPQAELKKIGQPYDYDAIAFKNSQIDAIKGKMKAFTDEWSDIVEPKYAPKAPDKAGRDVWRGGDKQWYEPNKRNEIIQQTYEAVGPVTGKKGYSKSVASKYSSELKKMSKDPAYGTREAFDYFGKK